MFRKRPGDVEDRSGCALWIPRQSPRQLDRTVRVRVVHLSHLGESGLNNLLDVGGLVLEDLAQLHVPVALGGRMRRKAAWALEHVCGALPALARQLEGRVRARRNHHRRGPSGIVSLHVEVLGQDSGNDASDPAWSGASVEVAGERVNAVPRLPHGGCRDRQFRSSSSGHFSQAAESSPYRVGGVSAPMGLPTILLLRLPTVGRQLVANLLVALEGIQTLVELPEEGLDRFPLRRDVKGHPPSDDALLKRHDGAVGLGEARAAKGNAAGSCSTRSIAAPLKEWRSGAHAWTNIVRAAADKGHERHIKTCGRYFCCSHLDPDINNWGA